METENNGLMRKLFSEISNESLPFDFNEKVMMKVHKKALLQKRRHNFFEIFGYLFSAIAMMGVCAYVLYTMGVTFQFPTFQFPAFEIPSWSFFEFDFSLFQSQSFWFSLYAGTVMLFLLIIDSIIRHYIEKTKR